MDKPSLTLLDSNKFDVNSIAQLYLKLTGKKMTAEELAYAEAQLGGSPADKSNRG